jgi:hypothetical protein
LNNIAFKKLSYSQEVIESAISDFKIKMKNLNQRSISKSSEIMLRILCCDRESKKRKIYNKTVNKIREYLDVNTLIKFMMEFQFIKSTLFSKQVNELTRSMVDLKNVNEYKINEIQKNLQDLFNNFNNDEQTEKGVNNLLYLEKTKDLDHYAVQYFIDEFLKK